MRARLLDLLQPENERLSERIYGVVVGIVTNNKDEEGMGRVRVRFPWLSDADESWWARIAVPMAGKGRGTYFLPEVDDEVLVAFEHGDARFPYVVGSLWNGRDEPPETNDDGQNNLRVIRSRSGHTIRLDDTDGEEKIEIIDKTEKNKIVIDSKDNTITVEADSNISLESKNGDVIIKGQNIKMTSTTADVQIDATAKMNLQGDSVDMKSKSQHVKVQAAANMDLKAGPQLNIKGGIVNIN